MIKKIIKENLHTNQEQERLIAENIRVKRRKQIQREERLPTVVRGHGFVLLDEYL